MAKFETYLNFSHTSHEPYSSIKITPTKVYLRYKTPPLCEGTGRSLYAFLSLQIQQEFSDSNI